MLEEVVDAPFLKALKARLDVALGRLVWWLATLHITGGLKLNDHFGPFQPRPFYDVSRSVSETQFLRSCVQNIMCLEKVYSLRDIFQVGYQEKFLL